MPKKGMTEIRIRGVFAALGLAGLISTLLLPATGCSGTASPSATRSSDAPAEGTIEYHAPVVSGTLSNRRHKAIIQAYTTADDELRREDANVQVYSGTLPAESAEGPGQAGTLARRMFERMSQQAAVRLLSKEQFADLWGRLTAAGLFELPPARVSRPPSDRAYFHIKTEARQWIITRPAFPTAKSDSKGRENARRWQLAETALVMFENDI